GVRVLDGREGARVERFGELRAVDVAQPVRADLPSGDELLEDAREFGDRHPRVPGVREVQVDALDPEPPQTSLDLPLHARRREALILALVHRVEGLGREAETVGTARANPLADGRLAA